MAPETAVALAELAADAGATVSRALEPPHVCPPNGRAGRAVRVRRPPRPPREERPDA